MAMWQMSVNEWMCQHTLMGMSLIALARKVLLKILKEEGAVWTSNKVPQQGIGLQTDPIIQSDMTLKTLYSIFNTSEKKSYSRKLF